MNLQEQINRIQSMMKIINENVECQDDLLIDLANILSDKLHCDRYGSCVHFAELFVELVNEEYPHLLNCFDVIEGYVDWSHGEEIPQQHTWIKLRNGEKIDPTFLQFTKYGNASYRKKNEKTYTGKEYLENRQIDTWFADRRKKYPEMIFKNI
jgi:hypothetical protein